MHTGNVLVTVGLFVVLVALIFEYLSLSLSGLSVGFGLVVVGLLWIAAGAARRGSPPGGLACDDCGAALDGDGLECDNCGATP